ncbi:MAG: hypothetical protein LBU61_01855, partial [Coriobacteriales bacterium]|nr:hypothetical protein [Coriobacteriales bacterium]
MMELRKAIVVKKPRQKIVLLMSFLLVLTALPTSIISAIATPDDLLSAIDLADDPAVTEDEPADGFSDSEGFPIDDNSIDDLSANPGQSDDTSSVEDGLSGLIPSGLLPIVDNDSPSLPALVDDSLPGIQPQANLEWKDGNPPTVADGDYIAISGSPSGTLVVPAGFQVVITGSVTNASQGLKLNIASGATVFWRADLIGSAANADGYLITIDGPGSFDAKECQITNSGQGGALSILGARQKVLLNDNALISSEANGNPVFIAADGVILIMYPHSSVISSTDTAFAAIQIDDGLSDVIIEINDSLVKADKKGNAISDGTGAGLPNNQTQIGLNDSAVVSSNDTAIYSNGVGSTIEVNYSTVSSPNSTSTLPVIHTVNLESGSVTIDHSKVSTVSTNSQGHAIQSTGSVILRHSEVSSVNGTAIKQVGNDKVITNLNSTVEATGSGTAVSIVPADPHSDDSYYFMYSGFTLAKTGNAIHFSGDYPKVSVSGGLVFAYGTEVWGENNVIFFENNLGSSSANEIGGLAIAWSGTSGAEYNSGSSTDLSYIPASAYCVCWRNFNGVGCIDYSEGGTNGYYPLDVTVLDDVDHGLIFDSFSGKMYLDMNDNQKLDLGVDTEFTAGQGTTWQAEPNKLTLDGFNWQTSKPWALLILGNNTEIVISGNNSFISTFYGHSLSYGIYASYPYHELSITGSGTLAATSGSTPGAQSSTVMAGIACHKLSITDATVIATGGSVPDNA